MNAIYILSGLGIAALLSEIFNFKKIILYIALLGLAATVYFTLADWDTNVRYFGNMVFFDNYALAFSALLTVGAFLWLLLSKRFFNTENHVTDYTALILFILVGAVLMVSYSNLVVLFIGIEILSLALYIMAGSRKNDLGSNEAAMKYFLLGSFATGFLLFGIALVYGATGSFYIEEIGAYSAENIPMFYYAGIMMIMVGLAFKVSAAPFHFWAPDVYHGSPIPVTSFMATIVKTAAFAAFFRLFSVSFASSSAVWFPALAGMAVLTLAVGNIIAVQQKDAKRLLAYSSLAHAGYLLMAMLVMNSYTPGAMLYYTSSYILATLLSFTVLEKVVQHTNTTEISGFTGLYKRSPFLAFAMVVALLSLAGIPPLAGFFAKYYVFAAAIQKDLLWLVVAGVLASLISVIYYFRILAATFSQTENSNEEIPVSGLHKALMAIMILGLIALGIFPDCIIGLI